jgi:putative ABC transport system permease protein
MSESSSARARSRPGPAPRAGITLWKLAVRSLWFHWRSHLTVLLGATLATAILVGALAVGDSVRGSLRSLALMRLGDTRIALNGQSRFFRAELADALATDLRAPVAPVLLLRGTVTAEEARSGRVQVIGVDDRFWRLAGGKPLLTGGEQAFVANERLARTLSVGPNDELLLRVESPSLLSRDAPLSSLEDSAVTLRLPITALAPDTGGGRFSLEANQLPPLTLFVPLAALQVRINRPGRVNTLLVGKGREPAPSPVAAADALRRRWQLADAGLELRDLRGRGELELRTDRVFLEPPAARAARTVGIPSHGVLTYFVNELRVGNRSTPYSVVSAMESGVVPAAMEDDEILINRWLEDDLQARPGDALRLSYYVIGTDTREGGGRHLEQRSSSFRIRAILPLQGEAADPELMPRIPGLTDREHCRDWEPGIPVDLEKIRQKDEQYWNAYRGTPKAFLTLRAGQRIWASRFGDLTAVRFPDEGQSLSIIEGRIRGQLDPASVGLMFVPVRAQALAASSQSMDFGLLFLGFSLFLIVAALLLAALLFAFGVEQRGEEIGTLLALGFPQRRVQMLLLMEGGSLALVASVAGAAVGTLYTRAVVHGLATVWRGAVADTVLQYHAEPATLATGAAAGFIAALLAIFLVVRKQARVPARALLAGEPATDDRQLMPLGGSGEANARRFPFVRRSHPLRGYPSVAFPLLGALVLLSAALRGDPAEKAGLFFGSGALLLVASIGVCGALLARWRRGVVHSRLTLGSLGVRNSVRRQGRSLATVALLACGSFLVVAVGANRHDPEHGAARRSSGTGGFTLCGESALPVYQDLNRAEGREQFGLDDESLRDVRFVPLRLRPGDDASCLNLNRPQTPRLLGVDPKALRQRKAFTFARQLHRSAEPWSLLERAEQDGAVPAVGDVNTVTWSLGKSLGDTLPVVDDRGRGFRIRIVGILANSVLQGSLLMSEGNFVQRFPLREGYQVFLIDAPATATRALADAMGDVGLELTPAAERLTALNTVENSYLSIFAALGGMGLLLGSVGLGVVVLRNVLERRGELALLRAVGFRPRGLQWLLFSEASLLLTLGLAAGAVSAMVAVLPALGSPGTETPIVSLALILAAVFISGFLWTWGATALALRGPLLSALRNE